MGQAEAHYRNALELYERSGDIYRSAPTLHNLASAVWRAEKPDLEGASSLKAATQLFSRELEICNKAESYRNAATTHMQLGIATREQAAAKAKEAKKHHEKALKIFEDDASSALEAAGCLYCLGDMAKAQGQDGEAIAWWWRC